MMVLAKSFAIALVIAPLLLFALPPKAHAQAEESSDAWQVVVTTWVDALRDQHYDKYRQILHPAVAEFPEYGSQVAMRFWAQELSELTEQGFSGQFRFETIKEGDGLLPPGAVRAYPVIDNRPLEEAIVLIEDGEAKEWKIVRLF